MGATDPAAWAEFGVALVGASAALAGLIFVAISINLREILTRPGLPGRAGEGIMTLLVALLACAVLLIPDQGTTALGLEWIVLAVVFWLVLVRIHRRARPAYGDDRNLFYGRVVLHHLVVLGLVVAGIATATGSAGGLYWIALATLWAIGVGVIDAWVLLVEILR